MMAGMPRYAAFLRGVSPQNASMPALQACLESAGFKNVKTLLSSGNVVFDSRAAALPALERKIEALTGKDLGKAFPTILRTAADLQALLDSDPYPAFRLRPGSKRVVTFLRKAPTATPKLPIEFQDARILCVRGTEVFSAYVPGPQGPVFMTLIEKTFGKDVTTRTWDTIKKAAAAAAAGK
jgi:uncharacterized protein (DUF1697 family)